MNIALPKAMLNLAMVDEPTEPGSEQPTREGELSPLKKEVGEKDEFIPTGKPIKMNGVEGTEHGKPLSVPSTISSSSSSVSSSTSSSFSSTSSTDLKEKPMLRIAIPVEMKERQEKKLRLRLFFDGIQNALISAIVQFTSVHVCCPWVSSRPIIDEIGKLPGRCSLITTIQHSTDWNMERLKKAFSFIYVWSHPTKRDAIAHSKFIIFLMNEKPVSVWTGSYNFTAAAEDNKENGIYIEDDSVAAVFEGEFKKICSSSSLIHAKVDS